MALYSKRLSKLHPNSHSIVMLVTQTFVPSVWFKIQLCHENGGVQSLLVRRGGLWYSKFEVGTAQTPVAVQIWYGTKQKQII